MSHPAGHREPYSSYQNEVYLNGLSGILPEHPMGFAELEERARHAMPPAVWSYVAGEPATSTRSVPIARPSRAGGLSRACSSAPNGAIRPPTSSA